MLHKHSPQYKIGAKYTSLYSALKPTLKLCKLLNIFSYKYEYKGANIKIKMSKLDTLITFGILLFFYLQLNVIKIEGNLRYCIQNIFRSDTPTTILKLFAILSINLSLQLVWKIYPAIVLHMNKNEFNKYLNQSDQIDQLFQRLNIKCDYRNIWKMGFRIIVITYTCFLILQCRSIYLALNMDILICFIEIVSWSVNTILQSLYMLIFHDIYKKLKTVHLNLSILVETTNNLEKETHETFEIMLQIFEELCSQCYQIINILKPIFITIFANFIAYFSLEMYMFLNNNDYVFTKRLIENAYTFTLTFIPIYYGQIITQQVSLISIIFYSLSNLSAESVQVSKLSYFTTKYVSTFD